jgi:dihydrodipicolinate synthase/N-acetylneuraminate lyase
LPRTVAAGLEILGVDAGYLRAPLAKMNDSDKQKLAKILEAIG